MKPHTRTPFEKKWDTLVIACSALVFWLGTAAWEKTWWTPRGLGFGSWPGAMFVGFYPPHVPLMLRPWWALVYRSGFEHLATPSLKLMPHFGSDGFDWHILIPLWVLPASAFVAVGYYCCSNHEPLLHAAPDFAQSAPTTERASTQLSPAPNAATPPHQNHTITPPPSLRSRRKSPRPGRKSRHTHAQTLKARGAGERRALSIPRPQLTIRFIHIALASSPFRVRIMSG
jgi:hypothetical protein